jgi:hypothetical protein
LLVIGRERFGVVNILKDIGLTEAQGLKDQFVTILSKGFTANSLQDQPQELIVCIGIMGFSRSTWCKKGNKGLTD